MRPRIVLANSTQIAVGRAGRREASSHRLLGSVFLIASTLLLLGAGPSEAHVLDSAVATPDCDTSTIQLRFRGRFMANGPFSVSYEIRLDCTDGLSTIPGTAMGTVTNNPPSGDLAGTFDLALTQNASALAGRTCLVSGTATLFQAGVQYNTVAIVYQAGLTKFEVDCTPPTTTTTSTTTTSTTTTSTTTTTTTTTLPECKCPFNPPFLVGSDGRFNNDAAIGGSLAVNEVGGSLRLGRRLTMADGTTVTADGVRLAGGASVDNVLSNNLSVGPGALVRGTTGTPTLPVIAPFCSVPAIVCGSNDVQVSPGQSQGPLAPGTYGRLWVLDGGSITLSPGQFTFCDIKAGRSAKIATLGQATLNVAGSVTIGTSSTLGPAQGTDPILVNVAGRSVRVSDGGMATAAFVAPDARITFGRGAKLFGCFCAGRANSDKRINLDCPKP